MTTNACFVESMSVRSVVEHEIHVCLCPTPLGCAGKKSPIIMTNFINIFEEITKLVFK